MRYKVGDKVKIRTWEDMEKEFGLVRSGTAINSTAYFTLGMEKGIPKNRIVTIASIYDHIYIGKTIHNEVKTQIYHIEEDNGGWFWHDFFIEGLVDPIELTQDIIVNRFELLDFED